MAGKPKHGLSKTKLYSVWCSMKSRCHNPTDAAYHYYGGRGIIVCERWREDVQNFFEDMGFAPEGYTLDRINNDGNYCPENCEWVSRKHQMNNRRCNRFITFDGVRKTAMQWSQDLGIPHQTIYARIDLGWPVEKVLSIGKNINLSGLSLGGIANGARNKAKTHCPQGHEYTVENTGSQKGGAGRVCKACRRDKSRRDRAAKK